MTQKNNLQLDPSVLTIFGITGDLARRYLLPALYHLANNNLLPDPFRIVGVTRQSLNTQDIVKAFELSLQEAGIEPNRDTLKRIKEILMVVSMDVSDNQEYARLKNQLDTIENEIGRCLHRLYYLAVPASAYTPIIERLGQHDLNHGCQHGETDSRLLIEKPFGSNLDSAQQLIKTLGLSFKEDQVYRIDHYLAKETVQNILTLRSANPLFLAVWDNRHINRIMITASESIGIEGRANFYEQAGAVRDIIQSHLLQVLALVTMEIPASTSPQSIHLARQKVLESIIPPLPKKTVRGQYDSYLQEVGKPSSMVETFAAMELQLDDAKWHGVPIYLRTGKKLAKKVTEITVVFKSPSSSATDYANYLTIRLQPDEAIVLDLRIKKPGYDAKVEHVKMDFAYNGQDGSKALNLKHPDAYERVIVDTLRGDQALFASSQEVLASWRAVQPVLAAWQDTSLPLHIYPSASWGPEAADRLIDNGGDGSGWINI